MSIVQIREGNECSSWCSWKTFNCVWFVGEHRRSIECCNYCSRKGYMDGFNYKGSSSSKKISDERERLLMELLVANGYLEKGGRLKKVLSAMILQNRDLQLQLRTSTSSLGAEIIEFLLESAKDGNLSIIPASSDINKQSGQNSWPCLLRPKLLAMCTSELYWTLSPRLAQSHTSSPGSSLHRNPSQAMNYARYVPCALSNTASFVLTLPSPTIWRQAFIRSKLSINKNWLTVCGKPEPSNLYSIGGRT